MGNLFLNTLIRSNAQIKTDRAGRVASGAYREVNRIIMEMEAQKEAIEEAISAATDLSTSNDRNSINAIDAFDAAGWASKIIENELQLKIVNEKLSVAHGLRAKFFEVEEAETEGMAEDATE